MAGEPPAEREFWERYWEVLRVKGVKAGMERWYERSCVQFIRVWKPRRLREATAKDVTQFLGLLAQQPDAEGWKVRQADHALRILFEETLKSPWASQWPVGLPELEGWMEGPEGGGKMPVPAKRPKRIPVVLTQEEVRRLLNCMSGVERLMARLLYGSGLRLMECLRLRVQDVDMERRQITVRDGKGGGLRLLLLILILILISILLGDYGAWHRARTWSY